MSRVVLIVGFGVTGRAVAAALLDHGQTPLIVDDAPDQEARAAATDMGLDLVAAPDPEVLRALIDRSDLVAPSPGVPDAHRCFEAAIELGTPVVSEFDFAQEWDDRPLVAVTGTDGKTTVTTLVTEMLLSSGRRTVAAGNTDTPLVSAIADTEVEVFVVEASSFRLGHTARFTPAVATWLNFGADHLDVHASLARYEAAKARIWADLAPNSVPVGNEADPTVARHLSRVAATGSRTVGFGGPSSEYRLENGMLKADGADLIAADELWRDLPHDIDNALAASATALNAGAGVEAVRSTLKAFTGLPHRLQLVGESGGVRYYDDSKATAPHATLAAVVGFESVVLIAGGHNKGLDLTPLAAGAPHLRAVIAIGRAADEVAAVFDGLVPLRRAQSMDEAVSGARELAESGDVVLLSPGCASFDWYGSYGERGRDFARTVAEMVGEGV